MVSSTDSRIRTKISRIHNTASKFENRMFCGELGFSWGFESLQGGLRRNVLQFLFKTWVRFRDLDRIRIQLTWIRIAACYTAFGHAPLAKTRCHEKDNGSRQCWGGRIRNRIFLAFGSGSISPMYGSVSGSGSFPILITLLSQS